MATQTGNAVSICMETVIDFRRHFSYSGTRSDEDAMIVDRQRLHKLRLPGTHKEAR